MYGYAVLTPLMPYSKTPLLLLVCEGALYIWTILDFINDIASVMDLMLIRIKWCCTSVDTKRKARYKFLSRLNDMWKVLGLLCVFLAVATFLARLKPSTTFKMATRFCALLLLFSCLRHMRVFVVHQLTGITFVFLKHMLLHLVQFLITIAFFVLGVGVFFEAIVHQQYQPGLFPGKWYEWRIWRIIYYPYYQYYGEVFDDDFGIKTSNDEVDWSVKAVAAIHMMVGNLLIVNLIIALFT
ncbi:transient receptor potential cation channel subfamily M member-like 2 [Saccostrea cucullata]|uniref:transient receptor potential cation channel subfamily M member-like 2 n=1 Tax=Saccostrea cuccullata TaxID=36930 RepID=UPI002ED5117D